VIWNSLHPFYKGKMQVLPKCAVRGFEDFAVWYTPGVAAPCRAIQADPALVYEHTNKGNSIAIVTDGTRVLGLGGIGPEAGLPVMEGKALYICPVADCHGRCGRKKGVTAWRQSASGW